MTAAKTSRMFVVSVACVRLVAYQKKTFLVCLRRLGDSLRVYTKSGPIGLHKLPEDIFGCLVNIGTAGVLFKELCKWNLVGEGHDTSTHQL